VLGVRFPADKSGVEWDTKGAASGLRSAAASIGLVAAIGATTMGPAPRVAVVAVCVVATSCMSLDAPQGAVTPEYDGASGRLARLSYDANGDGRAEAVASMDGREVRSVEIDHDGDGLPDRWEYYHAPAAADTPRQGEAPRLRRVEQVVRHGTTIVRRETYEDGQLVRVIEDRDADGRNDRWEEYVDGALVGVILDTTGSGRADRRIAYAGEAMTVETLAAGAR
jgi:hypothetical protein